jgi:predicted RNA binding protein YcfA (HicA-like mRNA interferase family)
MSEIPLLSSTELIRILGSFGFTPVRQTGTHNHLFHSGSRRLVTVPSHPAVASGVVLSIIRKGDIDQKEFLRRSPAP